jgi:hypothetical protein
LSFFLPVRQRRGKNFSTSNNPTLETLNIRTLHGRPAN